MPITLYELCGANQAHRFSPYCWRAKMAIAHKGFEIEGIATPFTQIREVAGGVSATVPVIEDNGKVVSDSWDIALYLEETYPDRPSLFGGPSGMALTRFVESWVDMSVTPRIGSLVIKDIHDILAPADQEYFRKSREAKIGRTLEEVQMGREDRIDLLHQALAPLSKMVKFQPYLGGTAPLYADYILFGALKWPHVSSAFELLKEGDPIHQWFERCQALYDGIGHSAVKVSG
ncbi:MAG: glutathione S-transferase family protein [Stappiaceae bacterium]